MENKINIAELLKDCPRGMELDCRIFDVKVIYQGLNKRVSTPTHPIVVQTEHGFEFELTQYGQIHNIVGSKCVIYPKGKTTWEGFVPPCKFKDGDILYIKTDSHNHIEFIIIFKEIRNNHIHKHACFAYQNLSIDKCAVCHIADAEIMRLATEEEKEKLFQSIKDNGYKWNEETKTLEKLGKLKFKVGDRIRHKENGNILKIVDIDMSDSTYCCGLDYVWVADQDNYELVSNKFDITTLVPFESKVIARDNNGEKWVPVFWGFYNDSAINYPYECVGGAFTQCIPYEGNEHLLGTTNDCDEYFKNWK